MPSTPLYVYGAGNVGIYVCNRLLAAGYNVLGLLDRNKGRMEFHAPVRVFQPGGEPFTPDACVCICLNNGIQHTSVARALNQRGYNKILFLPIFLNSMPAKRMIGAFNRFIAGELDTMKDIPLYDKLWEVHIEDYLLREEGEFVTAMIPSIHVYTSKKKFEDRHPFEVYSPEALCDTPGFFHDSPLGTAADYARDKLAERGDMYAFFQSALFDGLDFFIDAASPARLNSRGYFNLLDGHHRSSFLLHNRFKGIPLRILRGEYEEYFKQKAANRLMAACRDLDSLPFSVNHPAFIRFPVREYEADAKFLRLYNMLAHYE